MSIVIKKKPNEEAPADYVRCSRDEAVNYYWKLIMNWKPSSEVWPFRMGPGILSAAGLMTGGFLSTFVRSKLNLLHYGRVAMLLPTMGVPGAFCPLVSLKADDDLYVRSKHVPDAKYIKYMVTEPLLLQSECPICLQMRAMAVQNLIGVGYPLVVGSASGLFLAERYATFRLPEFSFRIVPEFIKISVNNLRPFKNKIIALVAFNALAAAFITDRQAAALYKMARKFEEEADDG